MNISTPRRRIGYGTLLFLLVFSIWYVFLALPRPLFDRPYSPVLVDSRGSLLSARVATDGQWRFPVTDSLSEKYIRAVTTFEDKRFFRHPGFDVRALARAFRQNLNAGTIVSGGSTITMQIIRLASDDPPRTIWEKGREIVLSTRLEWQYSKRRLLEIYASHAPFGGNVVGIDAAAWRYFGKPATRISWAEATLLAVLPNSPSLLHLGQGRDDLLAKRNRLLNRLHQQSAIDSLTLEAALAEPLPPQPRALPNEAPHLMARLSQSQKRSGAYRTTVSLDQNLQIRVSATLDQHYRRLKGQGIHNLAAIVIHVPTGEVRAYVGNVLAAGAEHGNMVDVIRSPRSTGSIMKPFLFAHALQDGTILSESLLADHPVNFNGYRPENYGLTFSGAVPARRALSRSLNIPFIQLLNQYGQERFHQQLRDLGLTTINRPPEHYGLSLILGGAESRLDELTAAYAWMGRTLNIYNQFDGQYLPEKPGRWFTFAPGANLRPQHPLAPEFVDQSAQLRAGAIWKTFEAMQEVERPASRGEWEQFRSSRQIAWKTGTSFGFRDAWAIGVTPEYAVGIWAGNANGEGRPGLIGIHAAGPVLFDIFDQLPPTSWWDAPYDDLQEIRVCHQSGELAGPHCPAEVQWETRSARGGRTCPYHRLLHLDPTGTFQADASCFPVETLRHQSWFILPPRMAHYYRTGHPEYRPTPPVHPDCSQSDSQKDEMMQLIYPQQARRIQVPRNADGTLSRTVFELAHQRPDTKVFWHIDDRFMGVTQTFHVMEFVPEPGPHTLTLVDEAGHRLEQRFDILAAPAK
jgi:penicillin-binding protein 1C